MRSACYSFSTTSRKLCTLRKIGSGWCSPIYWNCISLNFRNSWGRGVFLLCQPPCKDSRASQITWLTKHTCSSASILVVSLSLVKWMGPFMSVPQAIKVTIPSGFETFISQVIWLTVFWNNRNVWCLLCFRFELVSPYKNIWMHDNHLVFQYSELLKATKKKNKICVSSFLVIHIMIRCVQYGRIDLSFLSVQWKANEIQNAQRVLVHLGWLESHLKTPDLLREIIFCFEYYGALKACCSRLCMKLLEQETDGMVPETRVLEKCWQDLDAHLIFLARACTQARYLKKQSSSYLLTWTCSCWNLEMSSFVVLTGLLSGV
jgi:hypothetical protein